MAIQARMAYIRRVALDRHAAKRRLAMTAHVRRPRSRCVQADIMKKAVKKEDRVVYVLDPSKPLSAEQKARLKALAALPDESIDCSDIPELTEKFWQNAIPNPYYRPVKRQLTVRLDADVLAWLRSAGRGYQTKLNDILRRAMVKDATER